MPFYNYMCKAECKADTLSDAKKEELVIIENEQEFLVWVERHGMDDEPEIKCPTCDGEAHKTYIGQDPPDFYFKGDCYTNRSDCRKQMAISKLNENDPYGYMRQPGEKDDLIDRLKGKKSKKYIAASTKNTKSKKNSKKSKKS